MHALGVYVCIEEVTYKMQSSNNKLIRGETAELVLNLFDILLVVSEIK
jgi:hypothetical protein